MIPKGITRSRAFRFNMARLPATPNTSIPRPLARHRVMLSRRVIADYGLMRTWNPSPLLMVSRGGLLHPRKTAEGGNPEGPQLTPLDCARVLPPYPGDPKSAIDCFFLFGIRLHPGVTVGAHWKFRGCRVHSFPSPQELLRPASWLALLSRTCTFELAPTRSPSISVEYDYVDKQSIPTAGLSPASPTALWAAGHRISRGWEMPFSRSEVTGSKFIHANVVCLVTMDP